MTSASPPHGADGSDAMNQDADYSAAALVLRTDAPDGLAGHAHVFTIGRGNDIQLAAIRALEPSDRAGRRGDHRRPRRALAAAGRRQPLRWLGPERGVAHMAIGAVVNACWDLAARQAGLPLWGLLAECPPRRSSLVDFRYLRDVLTRDEALAILDARLRRAPSGSCSRGGLPRLHHDPGLARLLRRPAGGALRCSGARRFSQLKLKVGARLEDDRRRCPIARAVGEGIGIALDANQVWDVADAIAWVRELA